MIWGLNSRAYAAVLVRDRGRRSAARRDIAMSDTYMCTAATCLCDALGGASDKEAGPTE